jgi:hypothetical protein
MDKEFDLEEREKTLPAETANSIKMQWNSPAFGGKVLLLVEHNTDRLCYFKLFDHNHVEIRTTCGCNSMKRLFDAIQPTGVPNFAIQDSDFARVCGRVPAEANYFLTDKHDHEMMCLSDAEIMKAIFENMAMAYDVAMVDEVFEDLAMLTQFKWYNYHHHLNVNFKGYKPRGKDKADLRSFAAIYGLVRPQSPKCNVAIAEADVLAFVGDQPVHDRFEITNGHDFMDILSQNIGRVCKKPNLNKENLRPIIYANFTIDRFKRTQLYHDICTWAGERVSTLLAA